MSVTSERDRVIQLAQTDFKKALSLARKISQPWFRCQALAYVARFAPDEYVNSIAREAISSAHMSTDYYEQVAATAWPIRALIERGYNQKAIVAIPNILSLSTRIENPISRSDALFVLWEAVFPVQGHQSVLGFLVKSCVGHWKAGNILRQTALILASENISEANRLAASMPDGKHKRQIEKRLAAGQTESARSFF